MQFYSSLCVLKQSRENFLGGPAFKTSPSNAGVSGLIPGWEAKISHASWPKKKKQKNRSNVVTSSIKTLKMVHIDN